MEREDFGNVFLVPGSKFQVLSFPDFELLDFQENLNPLISEFLR